MMLDPDAQQAAERIWSRWRAGETMAQIAESLGRPVEALYALVAMHRVRPPKPRLECPYTAAELEDLYWGRHMAYIAIGVDAARLLGRDTPVAPAVVHRWLRAAGVPTRRAGGTHRRLLATRPCALCGAPVTRRQSEFRLPPERTYCSKACANRASAAAREVRHAANMLRAVGERPQPAAVRRHIAALERRAAARVVAARAALERARLAINELNRYREDIGG